MVYPNGEYRKFVFILYTLCIIIFIYRCPPRNGESPFTVPEPRSGESPFTVPEPRSGESRSDEPCSSVKRRPAEQNGESPKVPELRESRRDEPLRGESPKVPEHDMQFRFKDFERLLKTV